MANFVLAGRAEVNTLDLKHLETELRSALGIQIYTDGGFQCGFAAAAVAIYLIVAKGGEMQPICLGVRGNMLSTARSAFHAQIMAFDLAIDILVSILQRVRHV